MRTYENGERYLSSVAMTLLQNCEVDTVRLRWRGEPFPSAEEEEGYTPAPLALPPMSQEEIQALYGTVTLEQLQANLEAAGEDYNTTYNINPIDRWDLQGDATAKAILDTIFDATIWNNVRRRSSIQLKKRPIPF